MLCKICNSLSNSYGKMTILSKHTVEYFRCTSCGFIQTESPYWLEEAYSRAIARQDVGVMARNELNASITSSVLALLFPKAGNALDFGGGHGIFVRMMRDRGYPFFWRDLYASNDYALGFEYSPEGRYDFLTAFEVLEHFVDPMSDLQEMMDLSDNIFVSTTLVPQPVPGLLDWWYYSPSSGQHIAFYTREALQVIAKRFGRNLLSRGDHHLFSKEPKGHAMYRLATSAKGSRLLSRLTRRASLIPSDFEKLAGRALN